MKPVVFSGKGGRSGDLRDSLLGDAEEKQQAAVPRGCVAVYVGAEMRRFVIPTNYLGSPRFRPLMDRMAEEFGFEQAGGLRIPCEEADFERLLAAAAAKKKRKKRTAKKNSMMLICGAEF